VSHNVRTLSCNARTRHVLGIQDAKLEIEEDMKRTAADDKKDHVRGIIR
jgi:hypothetical protein